MAVVSTEVCISAQASASAMESLVWFAGVGLSGLVRHLPKTIPIVCRFSHLDCSALRTPKIAIAHVETGQSWCIWHASAMESSNVCGCRLARMFRGTPREVHAKIWALLNVWHALE